MKSRLFSLLKSQKGLRPLHGVWRFAGFSSTSTGRNAFDKTRMITDSVPRVVMESTCASKVSVGANTITKDILKAGAGSHILFRGRHISESRVSSLDPHHLSKHCGGYLMIPRFARSLASSSASQSSGETQQQHRKAVSILDENVDDAPTYNIPEKPVTFVEGASYSLVILAGLVVTVGAGYTVCKELLLEPKEYKVFGKALDRVQNDSQVRVRIGSPIKGYGQETRNRAARQQIPNKSWTDADGVEHVQISFVVRGPNGYGNAFSEMFKDKEDKQWKFTYLIVEIKSPTQVQLMLESYLPPV